MNRNLTHLIIIILAAIGIKAAGPKVRGILAILFLISAIALLSGALDIDKMSHLLKR